MDYCNTMAGMDNPVTLKSMESVQTAEVKESIKPTLTPRAGKQRPWQS